ncbi:MAG: glycosyltransferase [Pirellulales bacterium]
MRASIIIAAHNEGEALWKTIHSCVETCVGLDYEILIADDASRDLSVQEAQRRFPQVRVFRHEKRQGASPTKALGARSARGEVLIFLDGHTKPEYGAIKRLLADVEELRGTAVVTPAIPALHVEKWRNSPLQIGHGYSVNLDTFECGWVTLESLRKGVEERQRFYESPSLIGCALAVHRELYEKLWGFDPQMFSWGAEDLDFGLKCWLMGHPILHDPEALIGHKFRTRFENYRVPFEHLVANQLRMARKNFTEVVWREWTERCRERHPGRLSEHPEGLWARVWEVFLEHRLSCEHERSYLLGHRVYDEFWYAERFDLSWPRLTTAAAPSAAVTALGPEPSPSPSPPPPCPDGSADQDPGCYQARSLMDKVLWRRRVADEPWNWVEKTIAGEQVWEIVPTALTDDDPSTTLTEPPGSGKPRNTNDIQTRCKYSDFRLTLMFRSPNLRSEWTDCNSAVKGPRNWGNSGFKWFTVNGYEVQILDSHGATMSASGNKTDLGGCHIGGMHAVTDDEVCGALYKVRKPDSNPVNQAVTDVAQPGEYIPDGTWNMLAIDFMAARYKWDDVNSNWIRVKCSTITVRLNGATVHERIGLAPKSGGPFDETTDLVQDTLYDTPGDTKGWCKARGPIILQEHDSRVQFKDINIDPTWLPMTGGQFNPAWQQETNCLSRE